MVEERINEFLDRVLESKPDRKVNERFADSIKDDLKSFQRFVDELKYGMDLEITEEGALVVRFSSAQGQLYTMYTYNHAVMDREARK